MEETDVMVHRAVSRSFSEGEETDAQEVARRTGLTEQEAAGSLHSLSKMGYLRMVHGLVVDVPLSLYYGFAGCSEEGEK